MAGAEGFEPSARGFGGDVGKRPGRGAVQPFQAVTGFEQVVLRRGDALLMLWTALLLTSRICLRRPLAAPGVPAGQ